tara:strand:- start:12626 stop:13183 length:558 start_codon:yes stop_codon:yes gene_type:complete
MIYLIDHEDSFTYNLAHLLKNFDEVYVSNYYEINHKILKKASLVVFSPGPGQPKDYPKSNHLYKKLKGKKKLLGICLGFQLILFNEGGNIGQQKNIYHGYQSNIKVLKNSKLFTKNRSFKVGRYHSLKLKEPYNSKNINITMRCMESKVAMAIEDYKNKIFGFQFHPDSFLTINGKEIIKKIISA